MRNVSSDMYESPRIMRASMRHLRLAKWCCGIAIILAVWSFATWSVLLFVPFLGVLAVPPLIACCGVLLYAVPCMAYLQLAQTDVPGHVEGLFIPVNPVRNAKICQLAIRYALFLVEHLPAATWAVIRWILWEDIPRRAERERSRSSSSLQPDHGDVKEDVVFTGEKQGWQGGGRGTGQSTGVAEFGVVFAAGKRLDIYMPTMLDPEDRKTTHYTSTVSTDSADTITNEDDEHWADCTSSRSEPDALRDAPPNPVASSRKPGLSPGQRSQKTIAKIPWIDSTSVFVDFRSPTLGPKSLKPVLVFIYDVGTLGPIKPRRQMFCLLGAKLADMGYVTIIPDIATYPPADAEETVTDIRAALGWVYHNISEYGGSPSQIYLAGHGLGAHFAMFTLSQDAVIRSRDDCELHAQKALILKRASSWGSPPGSAISHDKRGSRAVQAWRVPNGLKVLNIYGAHVPLPEIRGIILLAPVSDIIKQIRHESTLWLEHLSPVRRALGPSQTTCMQNSLGHLLFAAKNVLQPERLPKRVLIIHGAQDTLVPLDSGHWLSELLYGLDVHTTFRPYRGLGHWDLLGSLMKGMETDYSAWLEKDIRDLISGRR